MAAKTKAKTTALKVVASMQATHEGSDHTLHRMSDGTFRLKGDRATVYTSLSTAGRAVTGRVSCEGPKFWNVKGKAPAKKADGGDAQDAEPPKKSINCGDCGETFDTSRDCAEHMREKHASVEAPGSVPPRRAG